MTAPEIKKTGADLKMESGVPEMGGTSCRDPLPSGVLHASCTEEERVHSQPAEVVRYRRLAEERHLAPGSGRRAG
jgi:hypothetical protein